jgi:2-polyprenyl-3-methyl-5-hydroxy-6-metoxy-1,4-benzoquinol methylase
MTASGDYFSNHARHTRFPWSLYHAPLAAAIAGALRSRPAPRVLVVGCGLEPTIPGAPPATIFYACDLDARAVDACRAAHPELADRIAVCPSTYELPDARAFQEGFDVVVAKEVVEHVDDPARWARALAQRVAVGGELILTTPNYGRLSTLPLLEATLLEWVARRDGFSRRHIHPSRFDRKRLAALSVGDGMELVSVKVTTFGWALVGRWRRAREARP